MANQFLLQIDPFWSTASVKLDNTPISQYSPLAQLSSTPVTSWIRNLPALLYQEANGAYQLKVTCHPFLAPILQSLFRAEQSCSAFQCDVYREQYSSRQRLAWAAEAAAALKIPLPPRNPVRIACDPGCRNILSGLPNVQVCPIHNGAADAVVTTDPQLADTLVNGHFRGLICVIEAGSARSALTGTGIMLRVSAAEAAAQLEQALDLLDAKQYLIACYSAMSGKINAGGVPFQTSARIRMLVQDHPCAALKIPARVEIGDPISCCIDEFPSSALSLQPADPGSITTRNGSYYAGRVGKTTLRLLSSQGILLDEQPLEIYRVERVTAVKLSVGGQTAILQGTQFRVRPSFTPANAQNTALAAWSVSNPGVLRHLGGGKFLAVGYGSCRITLTVERVSGSVDVNILRMASDIQLPPQIQLRDGTAGIIVSAPLYPANSGCSKITARSLDPSIAHWDTSTKTLRPMAEGHTELEVCLFDASGRNTVKKRCPVEVLPEKDIKTPLPSAVLSILVLVFTLSIPNLDIRTTLAYLLLPCACWMAWDLIQQIRTGQHNGRWLLAAMIAANLYVSLPWLL